MIDQRRSDAFLRFQTNDLVQQKPTVVPHISDTTKSGYLNLGERKALGGTFSFAIVVLLELEADGGYLFWISEMVWMPVRLPTSAADRNSQPCRFFSLRSIGNTGLRSDICDE